MRIFAFIIVILLALYTPFLVFIMGALAYAVLIKKPYELVVLGVCIDAQFGDTTRSLWYLYTLGTGIIFIMLSVFRPYLIFHT